MSSIGAKSIPILDIWRRYVGSEFKQKGRNHWAACPFHADKTPSLNIDSDKNRWHCFSCGAGGSAIDLVMKIRDVGFREACEIIERDFGLSRDVHFQPVRRKKPSEQMLEMQYFGLIDLLILDKKEIKLQLRVFADPDQIPGNLVHRLGEIEVALEELLGGSISEKAAALRKGLEQRWQKLANS